MKKPIMEGFRVLVLRVGFSESKVCFREQELLAGRAEAGGAEQRLDPTGGTD